MKLIKLTEEHYVTQTDYDLKITHSFGKHIDGVDNRPLAEVEEAINGYSVEKLIDDLLIKRGEHHSRVRNPLYSEERQLAKDLLNAHKELVKDKLFTVEDMKNLMHESIIFSENNRHLSLGEYALANKEWWDKKIKSLLPKTEWEVEFDENGKLKLLNTHENEQ